MPTFYAYLQGEQGEFPDQTPGDYRLASFVGVIGSDQLVTGPIFDTANVDDLHEVLMLVGLRYDEMQPIRRDDGAATRFAWTGFEPILAINPEIVFALNEPAAGDFLLDLKNAAEMIRAIRPNGQGGCVFEIVEPQQA
ncbi:MAG TPA: hypothetical protein VMU18_06545 [Rhodoblastus sp.]|nr:hypothetical protein [Rhodoblastus sp.]